MLCPAFLSLFWNMSVLCLVEHIHIASHDFTPLESTSLLHQGARLQRSAVTALLATAKRVVDVSTMRAFEATNSIQGKLQFFSHHANTSLVVVALAKAIEHTIDLNMTPYPEDLSASFPHGPTDWVSSIQPLLTCLLTLGSTVSGKFTVTPALQKLMQQYGDILMECWVHQPEST